MGVQELPLVDADAVAEALGCRTDLVRKLAKTKTIPSVRLGKLLRFSVRDVVEALKQNSLPQQAG